VGGRFARLPKGDGERRRRSATMRRGDLTARHGSAIQEDEANALAVAQHVLTPDQRMHLV